TVSFPLVPVIDAETTSPTLTPPMLATLPVTLVALVTAAVTPRPPPTVIEVALTAVTGPPISRRNVAPDGIDGIAPPAFGASRVPLPAPPVGAPPDGVLPAFGALELGVELAAVGTAAASCTATATTPNPVAPATSAVTTSSSPRRRRSPPPRRHPPGGSGYPPGGYPGAGQARPASPGLSSSRSFRSSNSSASVKSSGSPKSARSSCSSGISASPPRGTACPPDGCMAVTSPSRRRPRVPLGRPWPAQRDTGST